MLQRLGPASVTSHITAVRLLKDIRDELCVSPSSSVWVKAPHLMLNYLNLKFFHGQLHKHEPGSSVSIASGYGLDGRAIEVRSPAEAKGFFL
jgi:hypothetical protein